MHSLTGPNSALRAKRQLTVHLVEDDEFIRKLGAEMRSELGYTVFEAAISVPPHLLRWASHQCSVRVSDAFYWGEME
jgi:CheY-like chemotaxis protein